MRISDWSSDVCSSDLSCPLPTPVPNRSRETIMAGAQNETLLTLTADIVAAHVSNNNVAVSELATTIERVHVALAGLGSEPAEAAPALKPAVSVRASVQPQHSVCLSDGRRLKNLNTTTA